MNSNNDNFNINCNNNLNNNGCARGMVLTKRIMIMHTYNNLYEEICSYDNLILAFRKARKRKTLKKYVIEFEKNLNENLLILHKELITETYKPKPLETFIINDPRSRKISKSDFRDRIVHHALCNIIEPIFEKSFIYDSYANRIFKGTSKAIERFEQFKRKASESMKTDAYILKADILHYFETIDKSILLQIIQRKIIDKRTLALIEKILNNHQTHTIGKGMPLGNLTSQFFGNIYLNDLDQYIKRRLRIRYYIRYVDDFIIVDKKKEKLEAYRTSINHYLITRLNICLHPEKTKIGRLSQGTGFLGLRIYIYHRLLAKRNIRKFMRKISLLINQFKNKIMDYDKIYDFLEGWIAYAKTAHSHNLISALLEPYYQILDKQISTKEINKHYC